MCFPSNGNSQNGIDCLVACAAPAAAVFASETEYLQHQLEPGHNEKCRSVFTFYTSNTIAQNAASIIKTSSRSDGQLTPSQRQHMVSCQLGATSGKGRHVLKRGCF